MESLFRNCVSEFDLNFLEQTTNAKQATPPVQCPISRKLSVVRVKDRLINVSQVVQKAKNANLVLLDVQKELLETKQELEETRNILFEKNEEQRVICDERSTYFNQASEYSKEIQKLKEQLKKFGETDYDLNLKDKIIEGYSNQMKGLQSEMDDLMEAKKRSEKEASLAVMRANKDKNLLEKKLIRLLNDYVCPSAHKSDKWLQSLIKKYLPNKLGNNNTKDLVEKSIGGKLENVTMSPKDKEENSQQIQKLSVEAINTDQTKQNETALDDVTTQNSMPYRTTTLEFEYVGSVDTGRGSSLAYSDGEKSFHSPDYYMTDSPSTVPNLCTKCNISKSDVSTSPIPHETFDIGDNSATDPCKTLFFASNRSDACTSPIQSESLNVATDTVDFKHEKFIHQKISSASSSLEREYDDTNISQDSNINPTGPDINGIMKYTAAVTNNEFNHNGISNKELLDTHSFITSDTEGVVKVISITNPVENPTITSLAVEAATKHINISNRESSTMLVEQLDKMTCNAEVLNDKTENQVGEATIILPVDFDDAAYKSSNSQELATLIPADNIMSNNEKVLNVTDSISGSLENLTIISDGYYESCPNSPTGTSIIEVPKSPVKLRNEMSETDLKICTLQEKETMQLNNNDNFRHDVGTDIEVQKILDKMRLQYRILTPIPASPSRGIVQSPVVTSEKRNAIIDLKEKLAVEGLSEQLNILRARMQNAIKPFIESLPNYFEQIPRHFTDSEQNEELLRNLLSGSNKGQNSQTAQENSKHYKPSNVIQGPVINYNKKLTTAKLKNSTISVNEDAISEVNMHENLDLESSDEVFNRDSSCNEIDQVCTITKKNIRNITIPKAELSDFILTRNFNVDNIKKPNGMHTEPLEYENTQQETLNKVIQIEYTDNTQDSVVNTSPIPCTTEIRTSIDYESDGSICGDDAMQQCLESGYQEQVNNDVNEEMSQNRPKTKKVRKRTKLEKLRSKMVPKGKIRSEIKPPVRKPRFKPIPIIIPQSKSKKRVKESDSAATLNEKSVYENAVKVIATSKPTLTKESKVIVEDCVIARQINLQKKANDVVIEVNNYTSKEKETTNIIKNNNTKLSSENVEKVPAFCNENNRAKRKRSTHSDNDLSDDTQTLKELQQHIISTNKTKTAGQCRRLRSSLSNDKSVAELDSKNCTNDILDLSDLDESTNKIYRNPAKRPRTSVTDCQNSHKELKVYVKPTKSPSTNDNNNTTNEKDDDYKTAIRKRPSTSTHQGIDIENGQTNPKINKSPIKSILIESSRPQRILRSSCVKQNKDTGSEKTPVETNLNAEFSSDKLQSKAQQNLSVQYDSTSVLMSLERKPKDTTKSIVKSSGSNQIESLQPTVIEPVYRNNHDIPMSYSDLSLFQNVEDSNHFQKKKSNENVNNLNTNNFLCRMIQNHAVKKCINFNKKVPDSKMNEISSKLETSLSEIVRLPNETCLSAMKMLVVDIKSWDVKHFLFGLIEFFRHPQRKIDLNQKICRPPAPPMTNKEQVLLYVVDELQTCHKYSNIVNIILMNIEYVLFSFTKTPEEFYVVESMSHFYSILCRSYKKISKLRLFIIDAMYCLQYKSIILIKQCLDVWMSVLPLGHMGLAKTPLVVCLVYLLHFYKCEDKLNRVQEIRHILRMKYNYDLTDWNETKILDMFRTAITEVRDIPMERKMLRLAVIITAKRNGTQWCHNVMIKKILQPIIADKSTSDVAKRFCVSLLGPLVKPYKNDMKVHLEMINDYLLDMLDKKNSSKMQEAIIASLITANKHNTRVFRFLLKWNPKHVSREFEILFRDYVRSKTLKTWKSILSSTKR